MKVEYPLLNRFWDQQRSPEHRLLCHSLHRPATLFGIGRNLTLTGCRMRIVESLNKVVKCFAVNKTYCIFMLTTNDEKNADSFLFSNLSYISRAGGWLRQLRHSWLFDAFPGFSFLLTSQNNHK
jgi:hypothetical protein